MPAAVIVSLVLGGLIVVVLVVVLVRIVVFLRSTRQTLDEVTARMEAVAQQTQPSAESLRDLNAVAGALEEFAARAGLAEPGANGQAAASRDADRPERPGA